MNTVDFITVLFVSIVMSIWLSIALGWCAGIDWKGRWKIVFGVVNVVLCVETIVYMWSCYCSPNGIWWK